MIASLIFWTVVASLLVGSVYLVWVGFAFKVILGWLSAGVLLAGYGMWESGRARLAHEAHVIGMLLILPGVTIAGLSLLALLIYGLAT